MTPKITMAQIDRPEFHSAARAVLLATAHAQLQRERMDALDRELLAERAWMTDLNLPPHEPSKRITEPKDTWLMSDADGKNYHAERQRRIDAMGYRLPDGHCPALTAEHIQRQAERVLVDLAAPLFGMDADKLLCAGLENYRKFIALTMKLIVSLPSFRPPNLARGA